METEQPVLHTIARVWRELSPHVSQRGRCKLSDSKIEMRDEGGNRLRWAGPAKAQHSSLHLQLTDIPSRKLIRGRSLHKAKEEPRSHKRSQTGNNRQG